MKQILLGLWHFRIRQRRRWPASTRPAVLPTRNATGAERPGSGDWEVDAAFESRFFLEVGTVGEPIKGGASIPMEIALVADGGESIQLSAASDSGTVSHTGG